MPHPGVEQGVVRIRPFAAAPGMQETDMSVFPDVRIMDGQDDTVYTDFFLTPVVLLQLKRLQRRIGKVRERRHGCCSCRSG